MLKFRILQLALLFFLNANTQNLVANGGFEDVNICTEFEAPCAPEAWFRYPTNKQTPTRNMPEPLEGDRFEMVIMENLMDPVSRRSFLYTKLLCPLESGVSYKLRLLVNPSRQAEFNLGICLTPQFPKLIEYLLQDSKPTLLLTEKASIEVLEDGWQRVEAIVTAKGGEEYFTLGNFDPKPYYVKKKGLKIEVKYLVDQIELSPVTPTPPCPERDKRLRELYAQNDRHSDWMDASPPQFVDTIPAPSEPQLEQEPFDEEPPEPEAAPVIKFVIPDIGFDFAKFDLSPAANPVLETCAAQIDILHPPAIQILGYTDNVGSETYNLDLSAKRALAVRNWFVEKHGLAPSLFVAKGFGESAPVAPNDTDAGRQANRRVEIIFSQ